MGVLVNLVPAVLTIAVSAAIRAPITKGTVRTLVAVVLFPLAWWGTAAWLSDGFWTVLLEGFVFAVCGVLLIWVWDAVLGLANDVQALRHRHDARAVLDQLHTSRDAVFEPSTSPPLTVRSRELARRTIAGPAGVSDRAASNAREVRSRMTEAWRRRRRLGESDCEQIRTGLIAQPVNTLSSLAYVAGGGWVAGAVRAGRPAAVAFGALLGAVGAGSVLYHGPCPPGASRFTTAASPPSSEWSWSTTRPWSPVGSPVPTRVQFGAAVGAALPVLPTGRFTNHVVAVLGAAAIATEIVAVRDHRAAGALRGRLAFGVVINGLSRTGGPLCRPDSFLQGHSAWHVLRAASLAVWARGALLPPTKRSRVRR